MKNNRFCLMLVFSLVLFSQSCSDKKPENANDNKTSAVPDKPVANPIEGFTLYRFPKFPVRVQYPKDWTAHEDKIGVAFFVPGAGPDDKVIQGVTMLVDKMYGARMTLEEYKKIVVPDLKKRTPGFALIGSENVTLGGEPAYRLSYEGKFNDVPMSFLSIYCVKGDILSVISCNYLSSDRDKYGASTEKIISSFEFL
jgi:hypothetical protein